MATSGRAVLLRYTDRQTDLQREREWQIDRDRHADQVSWPFMGALQRKVKVNKIDDAYPAILHHGTPFNSPHFISKIDMAPSREISTLVL